MKKNFPLMMMSAFTAIAVILWRTFDNVFYLYNFLYLGATVSIGVFLFRRGWCGYACWTAMVLDFLPWEIPANPRSERLGILHLRFALFVLSIAFTLIVMNVSREPERTMWAAFLAGNVLYYGAGIALAVSLEDNRAFCKYLCPVTVFLKPCSYFVFVRVEVDKTKCVRCGKCERICPMNVEVTNNVRSRKNGTECILCLECVKNCPTRFLT